MKFDDKYVMVDYGDTFWRMTSSGWFICVSIFIFVAIFVNIKVIVDNIVV